MMCCSPHHSVEWCHCKETSFIVYFLGHKQVLGILNIDVPITSMTHIYNLDNMSRTSTSVTKELF